MLVMFCDWSCHSASQLRKDVENCKKLQTDETLCCESFQNPHMLNRNHFTFNHNSTLFKSVVLAKTQSWIPIVDCPTRWSLWYWYLDFYVYHLYLYLYFNTQIAKKYSTAMCQNAKVIVHQIKDYSFGFSGWWQFNSKWGQLQTWDTLHWFLSSTMCTFKEFSMTEGECGMIVERHPAYCL